MQSKVEDGMIVEYELCSGQTNYWYTVNVWKGGELVYQSEPCESLTPGCEETLDLDDGTEVTYQEQSV